VGVAVTNVTVELDEAAGVEELLEPLAREQLAAPALALDGALVARVQSLLPEPLERGELRLRRLEILGLRHARSLLRVGTESTQLARHACAFRR
jgi:hypothetical protein